MTNTILRNILSPELSQEQARIIVDAQFTRIIEQAKSVERSRAPESAKNLSEFYGLVKNVIDQHERLQNITEDAKIVFTEEEPDYLKDKQVTITISLVSRKPAEISSKHNSDLNKVVNLTPMLREEIDDPENPGYKRAILGYFHDNEVKFTVWARTNKVANERALWFEGLMQEYRWYFTAQGVPRVIFLERTADSFSELNGQKLYSRPIHFLVKTETITTISQKTLEQIMIGPVTEPGLTLLSK